MLSSPHQPHLAELIAKLRSKWTLLRFDHHFHSAPFTEQFFWSSFSFGPFYWTILLIIIFTRPLLLDNSFDHHFHSAPLTGQSFFHNFHSDLFFKLHFCTKLTQELKQELKNFFFRDFHFDLISVFQSPTLVLFPALRRKVFIRT